MKFAYETGSHYKGYTVVQSTPIPELACHLVELTHNASGAHVISIQNDDPENLFCLSFRTLPESSNGAAHILEHTVLCGSKKYPINDPFFSMSRRSLNTFMNALTGQDFTCYPAATQIEKDFYNLLSVYLDAVFHPLLKPLSFAQEGHRLEFAVVDDPTSELTFKGVVYNEMKGALSSPTTRLLEAINEYLFPGSPYGYNSGGDPADIPSLTHEGLIKFHNTYYHPSHCLFFFYGNLPLEKHLDFIEEHALAGVKKRAPLPPIVCQQRRLTPVRKELFYPVMPDDKDESKPLLGFGFLTTSTLNGLEVLALHVLDIILMETDGSLLKYALLQSGLCKQASSYLGSESLEIPYVFILKGVEHEHLQAIEELIHNTIKTIANTGIPEHLIESALHQLELSKLEISSNGGGPFGLSLFARTGLLTQHGGNAKDGLRIYSLFEELRTLLEDNPRYIADLAMKYLVQNTHFVRIALLPSSTLAEQEVQQEKNMLEKIERTLTDQERQRIVTQAQELIRLQEEDASEKVEILPKMTISDVPQKVRDFEMITHTENNLLVCHHSCFTNHLTYVNLLFPLPAIEEKDIWLLRLFSQLATQVGVGNRNYQANLEYVQQHTGGISTGFSLYHQVEQPEIFTPSFYMKGMSLHRKSDRLFSLLQEMAIQLDFSDRKRIKELIGKLWTNLSSSINQNALRYAINISQSHLSPSHLITQKSQGLDYFHMIRTLMQNYEAREEQLLVDLERIKELVFCNEGAHLVISCDHTEMEKYKENAFYGMAELPLKQFTPWKNQLILPHNYHQARVISSPVAFTAKAFSTIPYRHPESPMIAVASHILENKTLHKRIREQGGAYGAGASYSASTATFYFYSHSDPNIATTLSAFEESISSLVSGAFNESDLEEAKLGIIQGLDAPVAPSARADVAYGWWREGKSKMMRNYFRNRILDVSKKEVIDAATKHLQDAFTTGTVTTFAKKERIEEENKKLEAMNMAPLKIEKI